MPRTEDGKRPNFGLPTTTTGQLEHSRQHREEGSKHPLVGYCPVAMIVQDIEAEAVTAALDALAAEVAGLERHQCEPCEPDPEGWMLNRAAVLAAIEKARP